MLKIKWGWNEKTIAKQLGLFLDPFYNILLNLLIDYTTLTLEHIFEN